MVFECEEDAKRVIAVLSKRFAKYGLTLHPGKTRMIPFGRPLHSGWEHLKGISFLGFMHYWGRSLSGNWVVKRKTASDRFTRALRRVAQWCRRYRQLPVKTQWHMLIRKVRGHYAYYGITGNARALNQFRVRPMLGPNHERNVSTRDRPAENGPPSRGLTVPLRNWIQIQFKSTHTKA
jgi:hypothetical protein